jgi:8-oxo-dGTP diphosphatase
MPPPRSKPAGTRTTAIVRSPVRDDDADFLADYDPSRFDRPSVAVDVAILTIDEGVLKTLLSRRQEAPMRDRWALPGGFVGIDESLDACAARVLAHKGGLRGVYLEQLYTFGSPARDPRTRVISVAHYALLSVERAHGQAAPAGASWAALDVPWEGETGGPVLARDEAGRALDLAFDHADILGMAVKRIRGKLDYSPIGFQLLPERFTLLELQRVHETVLDRPVNKDSFRRRMLASGQLEATGEYQRGAVHRPAELYRFSRRSAV